MQIEYRYGESAYTAAEFLALARRVWPRDYDVTQTEKALHTTINVGAWAHGRLVGSVRVLSDGYFLSTVPELMVDPDYQRRGIGRVLMHNALWSRSTAGALTIRPGQPAGRRYDPSINPVMVVRYATCS